MKYISKREEDTLALGQKLGETLRGGEIILLSGELGAGKTVFTKGLEISDTIVSPTFTLMNAYEGRLRLYHYDAYRLSGAAEAQETGICEYFGAKDGVCVIEWAQNITDALRGFSTKTVCITYNNDETRLIEIADE